MRIVSLLPACTEWVAAFGSLPGLVGRSHACDYPRDVQEVPVVTRPHERDANTRSLDAKLRQTLQDGISPFVVDVGLLAKLRPDVVLTQTQCHVCAVTEEQVLDALAKAFRPAPRLFSMHPRTLKEVLDQALALGRLLGRSAEAMRTIARLEMQLHLLRRRIGIERTTPTAEMPTVAALEWIEPVMTAGHWTPDLIELAGGRPVCSGAGERSRVLDWDVLRREDPDVIAVIPCGMTVGSARRDAHYLTSRDGWEDLSAVRGGRVYLFDGNAYFNRPGPRLYRSIELLAAVLYGDRARVDVEAGEMMPLMS